MNINVIRISFDGTESVGVIPKLKPTVASAEIASNRHGIRGRLSRMLSVLRFDALADAEHTRSSAPARLHREAPVAEHHF